MSFFATFFSLIRESLILNSRRNPLFLCSTRIFGLLHIIYLPL